MADMTFKVDLVADSWTSIADGDTYGAVGIQRAAGPLLIFIGESSPNVSETNYLDLSGRTNELSVNLAAGQTMYGRVKFGTGIVRGFRELAT